MSLTKNRIIREFRDALDNPDVPQPERHMIAELSKMEHHWLRMLNVLNFSARVEESVAMLDTRQRILQMKMEQAEMELQRAQRAAGRYPQVKASRKPTKVTRRAWSTARSCIGHHSLTVE